MSAICWVCGCEIDTRKCGDKWKYDAFLGKSSHLLSEGCISALKDKLAEKEPKPERFALMREKAKRYSKVEAFCMTPGIELDIREYTEAKELLQAYDEAKEVLSAWDTNVDIVDWNVLRKEWNDKWG